MTDIIKATLLGPVNVGKTSILERLKNDYFSFISEPTIGICHRQVTISGINFSVWDTAGEERYMSMTPIYYRNSHILIFVFDVSKPDSIDDMCNFIRDAMLNSDAKRSKMHFIIVGNKIDIIHPEYDELTERFRQNPIVKEYALEKINVIFMSARTGFGCNRLEARMIEYGNKKVAEVNTDKIIILDSTPVAETGCSC